MVFTNTTNVLRTQWCLQILRMYFRTQWCLQVLQNVLRTEWCLQVLRMHLELNGVYKYYEYT
jgi:hypothetical protein